MSKAVKQRQGISPQGAGTWEISVSHGFDPKTGKRRRVYETFRGSFKQAQQRRAEILTELDRNDYVADKRQTVEEYLIGWLPAIRPRMRASSWERCRHLVEHQIIPGIGAIRLRELTAEDLDAFYARLLDTGNLRSGKGLSPRTVQYIHAVIHKALGDAAKKRRLAHNVAQYANRPQGSAGEMATWTADELGRFLSSVREDRLFALWHLLATTGMRRGEALGIRWCDLDLDIARASIVQTLISIGYKVTTSEPKTRRGRRSIALDAETVSALRAHRTRHLQERAAAGLGKPADDGLVFTQADGSSLNPDLVSDWFRSHVRAAGLKPIRLHDLRHTYVTLGLAKTDPKTMSARLGHATVAFTLDRYTHAVSALDEEAAEIVAGLIPGL